MSGNGSDRFNFEQEAAGNSGAVTSVTGTAPITVGGTATDPIVGISTASGAAAGTMSAANFTKLAGIAASATNTPLTANTPQPVGTAAVGVGTEAARDDHVHAMANGFAALGANYTISGDNGAYEDTGLSISLPSAGTYLVWYTARTNIAAAAGGSGAYILTELYNSTDAAAIANSEQIGAYATTITASYYGVGTVIARVTIAASKTVKLYAKSVAPTSTTTRTVNSDTNGRTTIGYLKVG